LWGENFFRWAALFFFKGEISYRAFINQDLKRPAFRHGTGRNVPRAFDGVCPGLVSPTQDTDEARSQQQPRLTMVRPRLQFGSLTSPGEW
jgi:hypothetical protein